MAKTIRAALSPHIQRNEYRMWSPILTLAKPKPSHRAGEKGLTKVPMTFPMVIAFAVASGLTPWAETACSTMGNKAK